AELVPGARGQLAEGEFHGLSADAEPWGSAGSVSEPIVSQPGGPDAANSRTYAARCRVYTSASVTAKLSVAPSCPPLDTLAERKKASFIRSSSWASIRIISPGRIIFLNLTSFIRAATGTLPAAEISLLSNTAPACMAASHRITPGTIAKFG